MYFKKIEFSVLIGLCITLALSCFDFSYKCENIRQSVFRLHILANSNSEYDQKLKIKVRDRLLYEGLEVFANSEDLEETILLAEENLDKFISCANDELIKNGCNKSVLAEVSPCYFNTRTYGETTLPAGVYDALQIKIGEGKGRNWWCVMYPSLCVSSCTKEMSDVLPKEETKIVENKEKYIFKFKIVEFFESIKEYLKHNID